MIVNLRRKLKKVLKIQTNLLPKKQIIMINYVILTAACILIPVIFSLPLCETYLFPKIVGGANGDTSINQIDVFNDYLAFAGNSHDHLLTTTTQPWSPLVGVIIINQPATQFKWAKANDRHDDYWFVSYSQDGSLIAAITKGGFIMVFDSNNGALKTSRSYSGSSDAQDLNVKSIIISSGTTPIAYAVSKDNSADGSQVFSFNPIKFSTSSIWAKKTLTGNNHFGITFGSNENIVYAYSFHAPALKVSRIDNSNYNPIFSWTYGFLGYPDSYFAGISHKLIDSFKDMLVITAGNTIFGVLIIPSTSPYTPTRTNAYSSSSLNSKGVKGIFIASETDILVLLSHSQKTFLATLNLSGTPSFTLLQTLPDMPSNFQSLGVFSSDGQKYYISSHGTSFYTNLASPSPGTQTLHASKLQSVIYSSDVVRAAYALTSASAASATSGILAVTNNSIATQINPYNDQLGFVFTDNSATIMKDLDLNYLNRPSWVSYQPFTINTVTQVATQFTFQPGTPKLIPITALTATNGCDTTTPVFTYTSFKADLTTPYEQATDNLGINSIFGAILVYSSLAAGTYTINVKGTLQTGITSPFYPFTLKSNFLPVFSPGLTNQVVTLSTSITYALPTLTDADQQSLTIQTPTMTPGNFLTYNSVTKTITFNPTLSSDVTTHTVSVIVYDTMDSPTYTFTVTVQYPPPNFATTLVSQTVKLGETFNYLLPSVINPATGDGSGVTVTYTTTLTFVTFNLLPFPGSLNINPPLADFTQLGAQTVGITLTATQGSKEYQMSVTVTNSAPAFQILPLSSTTLYLGETKTYKLPTINDAEGHSITITHSIPMSFITFDNVDTFSFAPTSFGDIGTHIVSVTISDGSMSNLQTFSVLVKSNPPVFNDGTSSFASITIALNSVKTFTVPLFSDPDNEAVTISLAEGSGGVLPSWVQLTSSNTIFNAEPVAFTDVGIHNVKLVLTTPNEAISFPFIITVTNTAPQFTILPQTNILIAYNSKQIIDLSSTIMDAKNNAITLNSYFTLLPYGPKSSIPNGIFTLTLPFLISITPNTFADQGTYLLEYVISDGEPLSSNASTTVTIYNSPPIFTADVPQDLTIQINQIYDYKLPVYADPEGMPVIVTLDSIPAKTINEFATIQPGGQVIKFNPNQLSQVQEYNASITLSDGDKSSSYQFVLKVINPSPMILQQILSPKFSPGVIKQLKVPIMSTLEYPLPVIMNTDDLKVIHSTNLPPYASLKFTSYRFSPFLASHLGIASIKGILKNSYGEIGFEFKISVENKPPSLKEIPKDAKVAISGQVSIQI